MPTPADEPRQHPHGWHPAQRLLTELCGLYDRFHPVARAREELDALLVLARELECALATAREHGHPHLSWARMRTLCERIQVHADLLRTFDSGADGLAEALLHVELACTRLAALDPEHGGRSTPAEALAEATPGRILLYDPDRQGALLLARTLTRNGHEVVVAHDRQTLQQAQAKAMADLVVLDLAQMDDGVIEALLRCLRRPAAWRNVPIIAMAERSDHSPVIRALALGADDYVLKPINPVLLKARIHGALQRKRWLEREREYREQLERNQRFMRRMFGRYLSPGIVDSLLENPDGLDLGGVQRTVTVLMADIRGFTQLSEQLEPTRVVQLLNSYLGRMSEIVFAFAGTVDEFIGDAVLAIFGAPVSHHDDSDRAIQCALAMQQAMGRINRDNARMGLPPIRIGISLNTGPVIAGNIGSERRSKYAVVGHVVNQTARMQEVCPPGGILLSHATLRTVHDMLCIRESGRLRARGMHQAIHVHHLVGITPLAPDRRSSPPPESVAGTHVGEQQHVANRG